MNIEKDLHKNTEQALTIPVVSCNYWFMEKLNCCEREKFGLNTDLKNLL